MRCVHKRKYEPTTSPLRYECLANYSTDINGTWTKHCQDLHIHMDIGLFGYYPLIDRGNNTYMQVGGTALALLTHPTRSLALLTNHVPPPPRSCRRKSCACSATTRVVLAPWNCA